MTLSGNQGSTEGSHNSCNIRTCYMHTGDFFQGAENRIVIEGSTLNHDIGTQILSIGQFNNLKQGIFDYGISQSG